MAAHTPGAREDHLNSPPAPTSAAPAASGASLTGAALTTVEVALDSLAGVTRASATHDERLSLASRCRVLAGRIAALAAVLIAEADAAGSPLAARGTPTTSWLALDGSTSTREAAGALFTATDVARHELVADAALSGRLGLQQARAVARGVDQLQETLGDVKRREAEDLLVRRAAGRPAGDVPRLVREVVAEIAPEAEPTPNGELSLLDARLRRARSRRSLVFHSDGDGSVVFRGSLPEVDAAGFVRAIDSLVESDRRAGRDHADDRVEPGGERRTPEQRRADALLALIRCAENAARTPRVAGDRPRVVVTMLEADLRARAEQAGVLDTGELISAGDLRRLCCDADLVPVVLGKGSEVLDVGRESRLVTPGLRRALSVRDHGCAFPHCSAPDTQCDAHHIVPWWAGGVTAMSNLVLLCAHHHALVEPLRFWSGSPPDRWEVRVRDGWPEFLPPAGLDPSRTPRPTNHDRRPRQGAA